MVIPIIMPKYGMTQEEATVIRWMVEEGATVAKGDPIMEVETDKVIMEVEAPEAGIVDGFLVAEGDVVPVTERIAYLLQPGEEVPSQPAQMGAVGVPVQAGSAARAARVTPVAQRVAEAAGIAIEQVSPAVPGRKITRKDVEAYLRADQDASPGNDRRVRATPAARRVAREHDVMLAHITGSGPHGRIQEGDVLAALAHQGASPPDVPGPAIAEVLPLQGMRRTVAQRMQHSHQTAPHITFTVSVDMSAALALRERLNWRARTEEKSPVTVTALLVKVCAWALQRHRLLNASLQGEAIHLYSPSNVGVAVALDDGLIVPVIHDAEQKGLAEIAAALSDLTERAQQGSLAPGDVSHGTFTISNLGMFGVDQFTAIINPPQSAILAVGRIAKCQVVLESDEVAIRPMMQLTLSVDHRVADGAAAARFLQDLVAGLHDPGLLLWSNTI